MVVGNPTQHYWKVSHYLGPKGTKVCKFFIFVGVFSFSSSVVASNNADLRKAMKTFKLMKAALSDVAVV